jgi:hypothetical protein
MSKQTAVEWLVADLNQKIDFISMDKWDMIRDIVQQAKAMEREQHKRTYHAKLNTHYFDFEHYYNEIYGGES